MRILHVLMYVSQYLGKKIMIKNRLRQVMDYKNMNIKGFSETCEIPYDTLQSYLLGRRKIGIETIIKLHVHLNININWLLTGEGEMYEKKTTEDVDTLTKFIEWLNQWWENADEKHRYWLEVQIKHYFPEYAAWLEKEENKKINN